MWFHVDHLLGNYFLQNDAQLWRPHFLIQGASDTSPTFEWRGVLLPDQHTFRKWKGCRDDLESHRNVTLGLTFVGIMIKRSREKSNKKKKRNSSMLLWRKTIYLKVLLQKVFEIMTKSSPISLTATVAGTADLQARNLIQREKFHATPLSSLPNFFWSWFRTHSVVKSLNKLFSGTITGCCFPVSSCCIFSSAFFLSSALTRKEDISNVTFLCDSESSLHPLQFLKVGRSVNETPGSNVFQISKKCWNRPLSKNEDAKAVLHFKEINYHTEKNVLLKQQKFG